MTSSLSAKYPETARPYGLVCIRYILPGRIHFSKSKRYFFLGKRTTFRFWGVGGLFKVEIPLNGVKT